MLVPVAQHGQADLDTDGGNTATQKACLQLLLLRNSKTTTQKACLQILLLKEQQDDNTKSLPVSLAPVPVETAPAAMPSVNKTALDTSGRITARR